VNYFFVLASFATNQSISLLQLAACRALVVEHFGAVLASLRAAGALPAAATGTLPCRRCQRHSTAMWLTRNVCCLCEDDARTSGHCPFGNTCSDRFFCPHAKRCFRCDAWSCAECGLFRGDGDEVVRLAGELPAAAVFLDFDRTIASTKHGASPLSGGGSHSVDPVLRFYMF
jgi:hypothetical protein